MDTITAIAIERINELTDLEEVREAKQTIYLASQIHPEDEEIKEALEIANRRFNTVYHAKYRAENKDRVRAARNRRYANNKEQDRIWRENGLNRLRDDIFGHYGNTCSNCGESNRDLLVLVYTGKGDDPMKVDAGGSAKRYRRIRKADYPSGYTVMCHNCNVLWQKRHRFSTQNKAEDEQKELERLDQFSRIIDPHRD